jgi:hypothetical protein
MSDVERNVELRAHFAARSLGDRQELRELISISSLEPLSDVRHDRDRGALDLTGEAEISRERSASSRNIDVARQRACLLPGDQIFKSRYRRHEFPVFLLLSPESFYLSTLIAEIPDCPSEPTPIPSHRVRCSAAIELGST